MNTKEDAKAETRGRKSSLMHLSAEERLQRIMEQHRVASLKYYYAHKDGNATRK